MADTQSSSLDSSALWLQVSTLRRSETQLPTSQGDAVNGVYLTQSARPPSCDEPNATRPPTYARTISRDCWRSDQHRSKASDWLMTPPSLPLQKEDLYCDPTLYQDSLRGIFQMTVRASSMSNWRPSSEEESQARGHTIWKTRFNGEDNLQSCQTSYEQSCRRCPQHIVLFAS